MTAKMLLRRTAAKSVTVTLWLMSITASSPATACWAGAGGGLSKVAPLGGLPPHPARAGSVKPAIPQSVFLREIIQPVLYTELRLRSPKCHGLTRSGAAIAHP